jgi:hypothetical protein
MSDQEFWTSLLVSNGAILICGWLFAPTIARLFDEKYNED